LRRLQATPAIGDDTAGETESISNSDDTYIIRNGRQQEKRVPWPAARWHTHIAVRRFSDKAVAVDVDTYKTLRSTK
jgi:hypothetical protein